MGCHGVLHIREYSWNDVRSKEALGTIVPKMMEQKLVH
jgi:hypothetical protein